MGESDVLSFLNYVCMAGLNLIRACLKGFKMAVVAVGHRGTSIGAPENSIASHEAAYKFGARGIEFDIRMSADGEFVIFHDERVDEKTDGTGKVKDMTVAELKALRLRFNGQQSSHRIPTLVEALENVRGRFMVDLDFKSGAENSGHIIRQALQSTDFDKEKSPLVTIFCRDGDDYNKLKDLNDLYSIRPLYLGKKHAVHMGREGLGVMGLRNYQFTLKRARHIRKLDMHLFTNAMQYDPWSIIREGLGFQNSPKKPTLETLHKIYRRAIDGESLFIQTDYLPELVDFLKVNNVYQDHVLDREFKPITPDLFL